MEWYIILLLAAAAIAVFVICLSVIAALVAGTIVTKPGGINHLSFEQVRRIQTELGHVDYDAYDRMEKERFVIHRDDGVEIACEFISSQMPSKAENPKKCLIYAHGFSQNRLIAVLFLPVFLAMGYSVLIYDQRGFGESGGVCSLSYFEKHDLVAIVAWVRARMGADTWIGLQGESMGAITILEALDNLQDIAFAIPDSSCACVYSGFSGLTHLPAFPILSIVNLIVKLRHKFVLKEIRPIDKVKRAQLPILFLHGTADKKIVQSECPKLFAAAQHPLSRMELFEGSDHCMGHANETERYERIVKEFVQAAEAAYSPKESITAGSITE